MTKYISLLRGVNVGGNILFDSDLGLQEAIKHAPVWWNSDADSTHNAIFAIPPTTAEEIFSSVGEAKPEYEKISYYGSVIFRSASLKTYSRTRWSKIVRNKAVYNLITIRNANTTIKPAALAKGENVR